MKAATVAQIKKELAHRSTEELLALTLRLARFKKENKELLTYLLFEAEDEAGYVAAVQKDLDQKLEQINTHSYYYIKKSMRKALRELKRYIRYSNAKETEVELLLHFCYRLSEFKPDIFRNKVLSNMYYSQLSMAEKRIATLHEDLQYDYSLELDNLLKINS
jgi:nitrate/TMAO reductase-like tetraheme cytochrome c subunit